LRAVAQGTLISRKQVSMVELIPLALIGLLCWYWWRQGTRLRLEREAREAQLAQQATLAQQEAAQGDPSPGD
jgi:hypothetical protein